MGAIQSIFAKSTISISDLRKNISSIIQDAGDAPVAVLNHANLLHTSYRLKHMKLC
jgi:urease beta subunit